MRSLHHLPQFLLMLAFLAATAVAGERPTCNKDTCDPRPDMLPYWLHDWYQDYRSIYNRPRYLPGKIAHVIEPTSQEAMVWCEANQMGLYKGKNCPPVFKQYNYPKPWETLQTGPRADFVKTNKLEAASSNSNSSTNSERSPSDQPRTQPDPSGESSSRSVEEGKKATSLVQPASEYRFK